MELARPLRALVLPAMLLAGCPEEEPGREPTPLVEPDALAADRKALREALAALAAPGSDALAGVATLEALPAEVLAGERAREAAVALERAVAGGRVPLARVEELAARLGPAGLALLAQGLESTDAEARRRVAGRLAAAGGVGPRLLVASLAAAGGTDEALLGPAREALARLATAGVIRERLQAVELLPHLAAGPAGQEALASLAALCADAAPEVRMAALEALCALGPRASAQAGRAVALLRDADEGVRQVAADALSRLGPPVVPPLVALLGEQDEGLRLLALQVLGRVGAPALEALLAHREPSAPLRAARLRALAALPDPRVLPALEEGLRDPELRVRQETIRALAGREADPRTVALLGRALEEEEPLLLRSALESLDRLGTRAGPAAPALVRLAREGPPEVRLEAVALITRVASPAQELVRLLGELLDAPTPGVRQTALAQLAAIGPIALIPHRERIKRLALKDPDPGVRQAAGAAMQALAAAPPGGG